MRNRRLALLLALWVAPLTQGAAHGAPTAPATIKTAAARELWEQVLAPVLGSRERFVEAREMAPGVISVKGQAQYGTVRIYFSEYRISVTDAPVSDERRATERELKTSKTTQHRKEVPYVEGQLTLSRAELADPELRRLLKGRFRSLLRADPLLHPQIPPLVATGALEPSDPQVDILEQISSYRVSASSENQALKVLVLGPTGLGKTVVALKEVGDRWLNGERANVVFILQDTAVHQNTAAVC